jgi:hypothetical protein
MSGNITKEPGDEKLTALLRSARPAAELPPGFQRNVWQRIEKAEPWSAGILEWLAGWLLTPRVATVGLALIIVMAAGAGAARGMHAGEREARDRYVASVDPSYAPR